MRDLKHYVLLAFLTTGCVAAEDQVELIQAPILGGVPASIGQYPTVVAVLINDGYGGLCTGTLVGPDLVMTAAHCVWPAIVGYSTQAQVTAATTVVVDTLDAYNLGLGRTIAAASTLPNPNFGGEYDLGHDDIALIRLAQPVTDRIPSLINRVHADAPAGTSFTLVGFGVTDVNNPQSSAGDLYVLASKVSVGCSSWLGSDTNLLCFNQTNGTGSCSGDSGGPAFANIGGVQKVAGVTSFGDQTCQTDGAYTRVDAEIDFLDANAPELQCQADGMCTEECGEGTLPVDPDCPTCEVNDDCDDPDKECLDGFCFARPNTPGGLGYVCVDGEDCDTGLCGTGPEAEKLCSDLCDPAAETTGCPDGFDCLAAGDNGACWPSADDGGGSCCAVVGGDSPLPGALLLFLFVAMVIGRRRRAA